MLQVQSHRPQYARLGKANWMDPERRQSINVSPQVKMKWRIKDGVRRRKCWLALPPASTALAHALEQIETLLNERNREYFNGETIEPAFSYDGIMFGSSIDNAQPTVVFSSSSNICRRNAKSIITSEEIRVDHRGIGMEYYSVGPQLYAGTQAGEQSTESAIDLQKWTNSSKTSSDSSIQSSKSRSILQPNEAAPTFQRFIHGALILVGSSFCTLGGIIVIDETLFGLTVAHAFERVGAVNSQKAEKQAITSGDGLVVGQLSQTRKMTEAIQADLDWAVCSLDREVVRMINSVTLPTGGVICPTQIAESIPKDTEVWVHTGTTGIEKGFLVQNHSLVSLPGRKGFQRMWMVILGRLANPGDCGSWIFDESGLLYGHIVAAKPDTRIVYILFAKDVFQDIRAQFGGRLVRLPRETDFVSEAISEIKQGLSSSSGCNTSRRTLRHFPVAWSNTSVPLSPPERGDRRTLSWINHPMSSISSMAKRFAPGMSYRRYIKAVPPAIYDSSGQQLLKAVTGMDRHPEFLLPACHWYIRFLDSKIRETWSTLFYPLLSDAAEIPDFGNITRAFNIVYSIAWNLGRGARDVALIELVDVLYNNFLLNETDEYRTTAHQLAFSIIGWLSMAYIPRIDSRSNLLEIDDGSHSNEAERLRGSSIQMTRFHRRFPNGTSTFSTYQQNLEYSDQPLHALLERFGKIIPTDNRPSHLRGTSGSGMQDPSGWIDPSFVCFYTLHNVAAVQIEWVDCFSLHLDFDRRSRVLKLFRYPSICFLLLERKEKTILSPLVSTISLEEDDTALFLRELLLSYRLVFGEFYRSHQTFNKYIIDRPLPMINSDPVLKVLCGQRWDTYDAEEFWDELGAPDPCYLYDPIQDFPFFGRRLVNLQYYVKGHKSLNIKSLWYDRRNISTWWWFWGGVAFGGLTVFILILLLIASIWRATH